MLECDNCGGLVLMVTHVTVADAASKGHRATRSIKVCTRCRAVFEVADASGAVQAESGYQVGAGSEPVPALDEEARAQLAAMPDEDDGN